MDKRQITTPVPPSVRLLDALLNRRVVEARTDTDQNAVMRLTHLFKRQLAILPDDAIEAAARELLNQVKAILGDPSR